MKQLREVHSGVDMKTILDMQIAILGAKKIKLSGKPDDKNASSTENGNGIQIAKVTEQVPVADNNANSKP